MCDHHYVYVVSYRDEQKKFRLRYGALKYIEERMERQEDFSIIISVEMVTNEEYKTL